MPGQMSLGAVIEFGREDYIVPSAIVILRVTQTMPNHQWYFYKTNFWDEELIGPISEIHFLNLLSEPMAYAQLKVFSQTRTNGTWEYATSNPWLIEIMNDGRARRGQRPVSRRTLDVSERIAGFFNLIRDWLKRPHSGQPAFLELNQDSPTSRLFDKMSEPKWPAVSLEILSVSTRSTNAKCPVCCGAIEHDHVTCKNCRVPYHDECWHYIGHCSIFGCGCKKSTVASMGAYLIS